METRRENRKQFSFVLSFTVRFNVKSDVTNFVFVLCTFTIVIHALQYTTMLRSFQWENHSCVQSIDSPGKYKFSTNAYLSIEIKKYRKYFLEESTLKKRLTSSMPNNKLVPMANKRLRFSICLKAFLSFPKIT